MEAPVHMLGHLLSPHICSNNTTFFNTSDCSSIQLIILSSKTNETLQNLEKTKQEDNKAKKFGESSFITNEDVNITQDGSIGQSVVDVSTVDDDNTIEENTIFSEVQHNDEKPYTHSIESDVYHGTTLNPSTYKDISIKSSKSIDKTISPSIVNPRTNNEKNTSIDDKDIITTMQWKNIANKGTTNDNVRTQKFVPKINTEEQKANPEKVFTEEFETTKEPNLDNK